MFEICSKLTIKTSEWRHWRRFGVSLVNFEQISNILVSNVDFDEVNPGWVR